MRTSLYDYCLEHDRRELLREWEEAANAPLTPQEIPYGSKRSAWWRCERGHEWQATVKSRIEGCGCPVCANRRLAAGENDLETAYPELARQWHPTKNGGLTPREVVSGTRRKVWWRCEKGHEWQAAIASRAGAGTGCPVCAGKRVIPGENDLASRFPGLAAQWHPTRNGSLTPEGVTPYSNKRAWWRCSLGHAYQAAVGARTNSGSGCPYCANRKVLPGFNDLATREPAVAAQWHPTLNGALTPELVTAGSHRKVWWGCPAGHIWKAVIWSRAGPQKSGCPVCAGRVRPERMERYRQALADGLQKELWGKRPQLESIEKEGGTQHEETAIGIPAVAGHGLVAGACFRNGGGGQL